jgi:hypothetical protein
MRTNICLALALAAVPGVWAQNVISARSGLIHYAEGNVTLEGQQVKPKNGEFPIVGEGQTLATENARAEVLLTPGVFLRLGEQSSFKMVANHLSDTRFEVLTGSAMVEVDELLKGNSVTILFHDAKITPLKHGLYRLDANENRFRVFDGEAQVLQGEQSTQVKGGHQIEFGAVFLASKFNRKLVDSLDTWAEARSQRIAQANYTSANMVSRGGYSAAYTNSNWVWNPYFSLFTFLPATGYGYNPYGWTLFSPRTIVYFNTYQGGYYQQQPSPYAASNASIGRSSVGNSISTNSSSMASASPSVSSVAAPSASGAASMGRGSVSAGGGRGH